MARKTRFMRGGSVVDTEEIGERAHPGRGTGAVVSIRRRGIVVVDGFMAGVAVAVEAGSSMAVEEEAADFTEVVGEVVGSTEAVAEGAGAEEVMAVAAVVGMAGEDCKWTTPKTGTGTILCGWHVTRKCTTAFLSML